jgi:hypothetical protein
MKRLVTFFRVRFVLRSLICRAQNHRAKKAVSASNPTSTRTLRDDSSTATIPRGSWRPCIYY